MATGTVKWFKDKEGYGFISNDDGGVDVFAHFTFIDFPIGTYRTLTEGQRVEFDIEMRESGPRAINIRRFVPKISDSKPTATEFPKPKTSSKGLDHHYNTLEVEPGATQQEIQEAYRLLASVWHPDRFPIDSKQWARATEKMKAINQAYLALRER